MIKLQSIRFFGFALRSASALSAMERVKNSAQLNAQLSAPQLMLVGFDWRSLVVNPLMSAIDSPMIMIDENQSIRNVAQNVPKLKPSGKGKLICNEGADGGFVIDFSNSRDTQNSLCCMHQRKLNMLFKNLC